MTKTITEEKENTTKWKEINFFGDVQIRLLPFVLLVMRNVQIVTLRRYVFSLSVNDE